MNTPPSPAPTPSPAPRTRPRLTPRVAATGLAVSVSVLLVVVVLSLLRGRDEGVAGLPPSGGTPTPVTIPDGSGAPSPSTSPDSSGSPGPTVGPNPTANPTTVPLSILAHGNPNSALMTPGPDGGVYVAVPDGGRVVVALIDTDGAVHPGWPVDLGVPWCTQLLTAGDGTLRAACDAPSRDDGLQSPVSRIFALDAGGRALPGWPVDVEGSQYTYDAPIAKMVGTDISMVLRQYAGDELPEGETEPALLAIIGADGHVRTSRQPVEVPCCSSSVVPGSDAGYLVNRSPDGRSSQVVKFGLDGAIWETSVDGIASNPSFDDEGNAYLTVMAGYGQGDQSRIVVIDPEGRVTHRSPEDLPIVVSAGYTGAGPEYPAAPIVDGDGSLFVVGDSGGTTILAFDPQGRPRSGWPLDAAFRIQEGGFCGAGETGCGIFDVSPQIGPDGTLYIAYGPEETGGAGGLVAIDPFGRERSGWPVGLRRRGAGFWDVIVGTDGGVWALAAEPEGAESYSGTLLSIAPDSTVRGKVTIIEP